MSEFPVMQDRKTAEAGNKPGRGRVAGAAAVLPLGHVLPKRETKGGKDEWERGKRGNVERGPD